MNRAARRLASVAAISALTASMSAVAVGASAAEPSRVHQTALGKSPTASEKSGIIPGILAVLFRGLETTSVTLADTAYDVTVGRTVGLIDWMAAGFSVADLGVQSAADGKACEAGRVSTPLTFDSIDGDVPTVIAEVAGDDATAADDADRKPDFVPLFF